MLRTERNETFCTEIQCNVSEQQPMYGRAQNSSARAEERRQWPCQELQRIIVEDNNTAIALCNILESNILEYNRLESNILESNIFKSNILESKILKPNVLESKILESNILESNY